MDSPNRTIAVRRAPSLLDRIAGTGLLFFGCLPIFAERTSALLLPLFALTVCILARIEAQRLSLQPPKGLIIFWLFLGYGAASALWALNPSDVLSHIGVAAIMLLSLQIATRWLELQGNERLSFLSFWLFVGFCIGISYLLIEVFTSQGIKRFLLETFFDPVAPSKIYKIDKHGHLHIKDFELNRNVAAANLLLWPSLLCAWGVFRSSLRTVLCALAFAAVGIATILTVHETSKVAFLLAAVTFALAYLWPRIARWGVATGFVALTVAIIPLSIYAHQSLQLDKSQHLQLSAQERVIIWGNLAERVSEAPILGVGVRSTYTMNLEYQASLPPNSRSSTTVFPSHAHNVYLQVWFELGVVGAFLLLLCGLSLLYLVSRTPPDAFPFALAALVVGMIEIASSWDIWQRWFFALLSVSAVCTVMAVRFIATRAEDRNAQA